ncbi:putative Anthocyanin 5-aromatic acyltransferase [Tripterygium wilfordii]|uniref:Putative Anthocyanin 5-aromatic acyltransferase n=1 Tax=Tripterygium wilfordii TaxID=458696 RepID=A0A7J7DRE7_TRIWF|nr:putative Anthocyanin 5-aromatic acyltransferase [Tripterygium wilfordii]
MASNDSLKIVEVSKVAPFNDSSEPLSELRLPITLFDAFWFRFPPVERVFYYRLTEPSDPISCNSVILPKLKHTLSLTLRHFLPLAGNLTWPSRAPQPFILYTPNDGVSLTVAESDADFDRVSGDKPRGAIESHTLVPELAISEKTASLLALQGEFEL